MTSNELGNRHAMMLTDLDIQDLNYGRQIREEYEEEERRKTPAPYTLLRNLFPSGARTANSVALWAEFIICFLVIFASVEFDVLDSFEGRTYHCMGDDWINKFFDALVSFCLARVISCTMDLVFLHRENTLLDEQKVDPLQNDSYAQYIRRRVYWGAAVRLLSIVIFVAAWLTRKWWYSVDRWPEYPCFNGYGSGK